MHSAKNATCNKEKSIVKILLISGIIVILIYSVSILIGMALGADIFTSVICLHIIGIALFNDMCANAPYMYPELGM